MVVKFYGNMIFFDIPLICQPIIKGQFNKKVVDSRDLLMYKIFTAPPDKINTYVSPEVSWYNIQGIQITMITGYEDLKKICKVDMIFENRKIVRVLL